MTEYFKKGQWVVRVSGEANENDSADIGDLRQVNQDKSWCPYVTHMDKDGANDVIVAREYRPATPEEIARHLGEECEGGRVITPDPVHHPKHYTSHPSGIECIQITEHMGFNLGNAMKYIWRADLKHNAVEDMKKAVWYIQREIAKRAEKGE